MAEKKDPLDQDEIDKLREMLRDRDRAKWGRGVIKHAAIWTLGLTAGVVAFKDNVRDLILWLGGGQ